MQNPKPDCRKIPVADPKAYLRHCTCGQSHPKVDVAYYTGRDASDVLAGDLKKMLPHGAVDERLYISHCCHQSGRR